MIKSFFQLRLYASLGLFFGVCLFFAHPNVVQAKSYSVSKVETTATLQPDGSMQVVEQRTYQFDGNFTFAYQQINKLPDQSKKPGRTEEYLLTDFSVCDETDCYLPLTTRERVAADQDRPPGRFYLDESTSSYYLKWFYRSDSQKTFQISYTVRNAVTMHSDIAELYWQWIRPEEGAYTRNVQVELNLPPDFPDDAIQAWLHGPLSGVVAIPSAQLVTFSVDSIPPDTFFEGRVIVPRSTFDGGAVGTASKQAIIDQETEFIRQTELEKRGSQFLAFIIQIALLLTTVGLGVLLLWIFKTFWRYGKDEPLPQVNQAGTLWEPPSDIDPAQVEQLLSGNDTSTPKAFTATVLSLVQNKLYRLVRSDEKEGFIFKDYRYYLAKQQNDRTAQSSIQEYVLALLNRVPTKPVKFEGRQQTVLALDDIRNWCQSHKYEANHFFMNFKKVVLEENLTELYFDMESKQHRWKYMTGGVIGITLCFLVPFAIGFWEDVQLGASATNHSIALLLPLTMGLAIATAFFGLFFYASGLKRTTKGAQEAASWKAFKKHLDDYSKTKQSPIDSIILWEKYLVYGTALGVSAKALSQFPVSFSGPDQQTLAHQWAGISMLDSSGISSLNSALSSVSSAVTASYGASGVGSSGGASGGGGGGGGGGSGGAG